MLSPQEAQTIRVNGSKNSDRLAQCCNTKTTYNFEMITIIIIIIIIIILIIIIITK